MGAYMGGEFIIPLGSPDCLADTHPKLTSHFNHNKIKLISNLCTQKDVSFVQQQNLTNLSSDHLALWSWEQLLVDILKVNQFKQLSSLHKAAVSCSADGARLGGAGLGFGTPGKLGRGWVVHGISAAALCMVWRMACCCSPWNGNLFPKTCYKMDNPNSGFTPCTPVFAHYTTARRWYFPRDVAKINNSEI